MHEIHCKKLLQMLPLEVAVILQYYCESTVTYCEPTKFTVISYHILHEFR